MTPLAPLALILKCFLQYCDEHSKCFLVLLSYAILKLSGVFYYCTFTACGQC